jgi:threonine/homoserine/homoserine lactone efflux protein
MWTAPVSGTLAALWMTRKSLLGRSLGAQVLAMYAVIGIYCLVYQQKAIFDTLQYVTIAYFLPGAILALFVGVIARCIIR